MRRVGRSRISVTHRKPWQARGLPVSSAAPDWAPDGVRGESGRRMPTGRPPASTSRRPRSGRPRKGSACSRRSPTKIRTTSAPPAPIPRPICTSGRRTMAAMMLPMIGAECDAHADFPGALHDRERHDGVDRHERQQQCDAAQHGQQARQILRLEPLVGPDAIKRHHVIHAKRGIDAAGERAQATGKRFGRAWHVKGHMHGGVAGSQRPIQADAIGSVMPRSRTTPTMSIHGPGACSSSRRTPDSAPQGLRPRRTRSTNDALTIATSRPDARSVGVNPRPESTGAPNALKKSASTDAIRTS